MSYLVLGLIFGLFIGIAIAAAAIDAEIKAAMLSGGRYRLNENMHVVGHIETRTIEEKWERSK